MRLVVDGTDDFIKDYQDGVIKLAKEKGHVVAQIKNDGKYGPKLPIKEETYLDGPNFRNHECMSIKEYCRFSARII